MGPVAVRLLVDCFLALSSLFALWAVYLRFGGHLAESLTLSLAGCVVLLRSRTAVDAR